MTTAPDIPTAQAPAARWDRHYNLTILVLYIIVAGAGAWTHQMWRDEIQAWLITRDSPTPWAIIGNLRYDGHPPLWYFVMWPISRITWNPDAMKLASLAAAIGGVAVFLWYGPWSRTEKALWPFGFYVLFEYGVKARSYNIGVLLLMLFCALWPARRTRIVLLAMVLGLMANVHIYFGILAGAGALALVVDRYVDGRWRGLRPGRRDVVAIIIAGGLALFAAIVAAPPAQGDYATPGAIPPASVLAALGKIAIPASFLVDIGMPISAAIIPYLTGVGIACAFLVLVLFHTRHASAALTFHLAALLPLFAFFFLIYSADNQHAGMILLALMAGEWIRRRTPVLPADADPKSGIVRRVFFVLLASQAAIGLIAIGFHLRTPYSHGRNVADYIRAQGWASDPLAGAGGQLTTVCGYLEKSWCLYADRRQKSAQLVFNGSSGPGWDIIPSGEELARQAARAGELGPAVTLVMPPSWQQALPEFSAILARAGFQLRHAFTGSTMENYVIYRKSQ